MIKGTSERQAWEQEIMAFVKESTKHFDSSHNDEHAWLVYSSAIKIMESIQEDYDYQLLSTAALLHDVCDHKYPESIPRAELDGYIEKMVG